MRQFISVILFIILVPASLNAAVKVRFFLGDVAFRKGGVGPWSALDNGQNLRKGDIIKTGAGAFLDLESGDGNAIRINELSRVRISDSIDRDVKTDGLSIFAGTVHLKMKALEKKQRSFSVDTPTAVCSIRGTEFLVASGKDGTTLLQVLQGTVALKGDKNEVLVSENQESSVPFGGEPGKVRIIKKRDWEKWRAESGKNLQGKEVETLRICVKRMASLDSQIQELIYAEKKNAKLRQEYRQQAIAYRKQGDKEKLQEFAKKAHAAGRDSIVARVKAKYKANKMDLIRELAENAYKSMKVKTPEAESLMEQISRLYERNESYTYRQ